MATYDSGCSDLVRDKNAQRIPVKPSHGETERLGDIASTKVTHRSTFYWHICSQLDDAGCNEENERGHNQIGDKQEPWASFVQDLA